MMIRETYWKIKKLFMNWAKYSKPQWYIYILYHDRLRRWMNLRSPKDLNEKINWLKFNSDTSRWTRCADKYKVREYIKECGCEELLVPLYGVWEKTLDIDFARLPNKFVLKPNHGCGDVIIVKDKSGANIKAICEQLQSAVEQKFGYELAEWHYLKIPPLIICEKLLEVPNNGDLTDYKVWCFNGIPYYILTCSNREIATHKTNFNIFDTEWNRRDDYISLQYRNSVEVKKPQRLKDMLKYAKIISKPFPEVRVDFYEIEGKLFLGEMTFTSRGGMMDYLTKECLIEMGNKISLPNITK